MPVRLVVMIGFAAMGLVLHTVYLCASGRDRVRCRCRAGMIGILIAAWIMAATYLGLVASRPQTNVGLFLLPVVLVLIGRGVGISRRGESFPRDRAMKMWGIAHGVMLLLGTVAVSFGFAAGLMYLVQSWRLKHHVSPQTGLKLPSLEWLQAINKQSLVYSSCFIALGSDCRHCAERGRSRAAGDRRCRGPIAW